MIEDDFKKVSPQVEGDFISRFPFDQYDKGTQWTKKGSPEGLKEKIIDAVERSLQGNPSRGIIEFQRLPDGGYQIDFARLREDTSSNRE